MDYKNYKLPAGIVGAILVFFIYFFRFAPYSQRVIVGSIFVLLSAIILILYMIGRKKIKSKWMLLGAVSMFLLSLLGLLSDYFQHNNIDDKNITLVLGFPILILFLHIGFKIQLSKLKDEKEIKKVKIKHTISMCLFSVAEIVMIIVMCCSFIYGK